MKCSMLSICFAKCVCVCDINPLKYFMNCIIEFLFMIRQKNTNVTTVFVLFLETYIYSTLGKKNRGSGRMDTRCGIAPKFILTAFGQERIPCRSLKSK